MGKYDHICNLTGAENYSQWHKQMTLALQSECLWSHCSSGTNPSNPIKFASVAPTQKDPKAIMDAEREQILDWSAKDTQAKALIDWKVSQIVGNLLNEANTTCQHWEVIEQHYSWNNILSQYELCMTICSEKIKDVEDITRYIGVFEEACHCFIQMGVTYPTEESISNLLQGLPNSVEWEIFHFPSIWWRRHVSVLIDVCSELFITNLSSTSDLLLLQHPPLPFTSY